jgi:hypothetical protein
MFKIHKGVSHHRRTAKSSVGDVVLVSMGMLFVLAAMFYLADHANDPRLSGRDVAALMARGH